LACLTTLSNRAEEIIVPRLVQSNTGVPSEVCVDGIFDSAIIIVIFVYLNNGAHPRVVVENCNFLSTLLICNINCLLSIMLYTSMSFNLFKYNNFFFHKLKTYLERKEKKSMERHKPNSRKIKESQVT